MNDLERAAEDAHHVAADNWSRWKQLFYRAVEQLTDQAINVKGHDIDEETASKIAQSALTIANATASIVNEQHRIAHVAALQERARILGGGK
jgi:predicted metal-dependent hydrolase